MPRPIIAGLIGEVLIACNASFIREKSIALAKELHAGESSEEKIFLVPASVYEGVPFWDNWALINNLVAHVLEGKTMAIVNPVLAQLTDTTEDDISEIIHCTDDVQREVVPQVVAVLQKAFGPLILRRCHEFTRGPVVQEEMDDEGGESGFEGMEDFLAMLGIRIIK